MPIITKISVQKKRTDRYNIFWDNGKGEEYAFSLDEDVLIKQGLKKGLELDEFSILEIAYQDDVRKAYNASIQYLARRMRSEGEVRKHLSEKEYGDELIQEVVHKLYEYKFLNDEEFSKAYVRSQKNTTDKGKASIAKELREKRIAEEMIAASLNEYPDDEELQAAIQLCEKHVTKNKKDSSKMMKQKLEQLLMRKGYSYSNIQLAIQEVETEKEEDAEMDSLRLQAEKLFRKYKLLPRYEYEQKMKQALYRKGFSIDLIGKVLEELNEEEPHE